MVSSIGSLGIVGCGWLGKALIKDLIDLDKISPNLILATCQSSESLTVLIDSGVRAEKLRLPDNDDTLAMHNVFKQDSIIICIPPQLKHGRADYPQKIQQLVKCAELNDVKRVILVSTTAVYNGLSGDIDENNELDYSAEKVKVINKAEQEVLSFKGSAAVMRFAGLIGEDRHPGRFLSTNRKMTDGQIWVNLIHQKDAVGLLKCLLFQNNKTGIFNGVSDNRITKKLFYQTAASSLNMTKPEFIPSDEKKSMVGKNILGQRSRKKLNYQFVVDDLLAWLNSTDCSVSDKANH